MRSSLRTLGVVLLVVLGALSAAALPPSLNGISGGGQVELRQPVTLTVLFSGDGAGQTYQWRKSGANIAGATGVSLSFAAITAADAGSYSIVVANVDGSSIGSTELIVKPLAAPVIAAQPRALILQVGQQAVFNYTATGSYPRTHQWRKDGVAISGATQATYTIGAVATADAGSYSLVVGNSEGSVTSAAASLTVNAATPPVLFSSSPSDQTVIVGQQVSFSLSLNSGSSPFTYQWMKAGVPIVGATNSTLNFASVALPDAGRYSVAVSNVAGSATSREAVLTVNPPTRITILSQPLGDTLMEGASLRLSVSVNGSSPLTHQWLKNGTAIAGATSASFSINAVRLTDAGSYAVVITNPAGSVTSNSVAVVVIAQTGPVITSQPFGRSFVYFFSLTISVQATGSPPLTYQWKKDGVDIPNATSSSYVFLRATPANSGVYSVVVTNPAGSVTSNSVTITVDAPLMPVISTQPVDRQVAVGANATLSVVIESAGTGTLAYQWLKNGVPIVGATASVFSLSPARETDAGDYSVVVTGAAGTVRSNNARLTVLPPLPPTFGSSSSDRTAAVGGEVSFTTGSGGSSPFTYQWMKNGVPISGATSSTYSISRITEDDYGTYAALVSNEGGVAVSPPTRLLRLSSLTTPWVAARQLGTVAYFLATAPSRIERFDLVTEQWLPTVILSETQVPTAFLPLSEGVYIAYGRALVRRSSDLTTETAVANTTASIALLFALDDFVHYNSGTGSSSSSAVPLGSIRRSTLVAGPTNTIDFRDAVVASSSRRVFGPTPTGTLAGPAGAIVASDGRMTLMVPPNPNAVGSRSTFPTGAGVFLSPAEDLVITSAGTIFRTTDLSFAGALGAPINDLAFFADNAPVALRDRTLHLLGGVNLLEVARANLNFSPARVFCHLGSVFAFGAAPTAGGRFNVAKVARSAFAAAPLLPVTFDLGERFSIDGVYGGDDGVIGILSRSKQALLRWSTTLNAYLAPIPLRGFPLLAVQTPGAKRVLLSYPDGMITEVPVRAAETAERSFAAFSNTITGMTDLGDLVMLNPRGFNTGNNFSAMLNTDGQVVSMAPDSLPGVAWHPAARRLYSTMSLGVLVLRYDVVPPSGALPSGPGAGIQIVAAPFRFNPEYTLLAAGNGRVYNADLGGLGDLANGFMDAAWMPTGLFTLRLSASGETEVQRWERLTYLQSASLNLSGTPLGIFALSGSRLAVVTSRRGFLSYTVIDTNLSIVSPASSVVAGVYLARTSNPAGELALHVRPNGTAVLLAQVDATRASFLSTGVVVNPDGTFVASARDLATGGARTIVGAIASDGTFAGTIPTLNATFSGRRTVGGQAAAGYYSATATNGAVGTAHAIVAADGRTLVAVQNSATVDGGVGMLDANTRASLTLNAGATLGVAINVGQGSLSASASTGALSGTVFAGLREGVARTDRLANISTRGQVGSAADAMIAGFVVSGNAPRSVLVRAIGPTLGSFGLVGTLPDPRLALFRGGTQLMVSDDWSAESSANSIVSTSTRLGAFGLPNPSRDAVLLATLEPGGYTAQVTPATGSGGVALVEVYDAGESAASDAPRLINIATRGRVGTGESVLIAGIVVTGNAPKRLLIRGVGPALTAFGLTDALVDPVLTLLSGQVAIQTNDDWSTPGTGLTAADVSAAAVSAGAFALPANGRDACLLITLQPGNYTAQVTGKNNTSGVALIEVYELPN